VETEVKRSSGCTLLSQEADSGRHGTRNGRTLFLVVFGTIGFHGEQLNGGFVAKQTLPSKCPNKRISILVFTTGFCQSRRQALSIFLFTDWTKTAIFNTHQTQRLLLGK
jgi:hypothetical protein